MPAKNIELITIYKRGGEVTRQQQPGCRKKTLRNQDTRKTKHLGATQTCDEAAGVEVGENSLNASTVLATRFALRVLGCICLYQGSERG